MVRESPLIRRRDFRVKNPAYVQNPLLAAANANRNPNDDDTLSDYVPESRDISVSRAVRPLYLTYPIVFETNTR